MESFGEIPVVLGIKSQIARSVDMFFRSLYVKPAVYEHFWVGKRCALILEDPVVPLPLAQGMVIFRPKKFPVTLALKLQIFSSKAPTNIVWMLLTYILT